MDFTGRRLPYSSGSSGSESIGGVSSDGLGASGYFGIENTGCSRQQAVWKFAFLARFFPLDSRLVLLEMRQFDD